GSRKCSLIDAILGNIRLRVAAGGRDQCWTERTLRSASKHAWSRQGAVTLIQRACRRQSAVVAGEEVIGRAADWVNVGIGSKRHIVGDVENPVASADHRPGVQPIGKSQSR